MSGRGRVNTRSVSLAQRVALMAMMTALAFVLSWIERFFPPVAGAVPGVKLGLANVVVLMMLYYSGFSQAAVVSLVRVLIMGFVFANPTTMWYSLAGGTLSLLMMALGKRLRFFSPVGVSIVGGLFHNVGQIALGSILLRTPLWAYLPILMVAGVVTGSATGVVATGVLRYLKALPATERKPAGLTAKGPSAPDASRQSGEEDTQ